MNRLEPDIVSGRRPVVEALRAGRACEQLLIAKGSRGATVDEIYSLARQARITFRLEDKVRLDRLAGPQHQGVVAVLSAREYTDYSLLLHRLRPDAAGQNRTPQPAFLVFLDSIQDPHNLGAIVRSAHATGADGVVVQQRHAVGLTPAAVKASAGAIEHVPVCRVPNLQKALLQARQAGIWIMGLEAEGSVAFTDVDWCVPSGLVIGGEEKGLRRLVRDACDQLVQIPMARPEVGSFNASVAAGLVLYEVFRRRRTSGPV